jgi:nucleolar GTP-binding protein
MQCKLFHSIKPLFANKPTVLVINKIDVMRLEDLNAENRAFVQEIIDSETVICVQVSCYTDEGVMELKNKACDALLAHRVENKLKGSKINSVINRIHVAQPKARDDVVREPFIPDAVKERKKIENDDAIAKRRLERDIEAEEGGAGVYNINLKSERSFIHLKNIFVSLLTASFPYRQRTIFWQTINGRWTSSPKSWTARTLQTLLIQISPRNSKP